MSGTVCSVVAQGLYQIAPSDDEASSSLPLTYIVAARIGYDSYPMPLQAEVSLLERDEVTPFYVSAIDAWSRSEASVAASYLNDRIDLSRFDLSRVLTLEGYYRLEREPLTICSCETIVNLPAGSLLPAVPEPSISLVLGLGSIVLLVKWRRV